MQKCCKHGRAISVQTYQTPTQAFVKDFRMSKLAFAILFVCSKSLFCGFNIAALASEIDQLAPSGISTTNASKSGLRGQQVGMEPFPLQAAWAVIIAVPVIVAIAALATGIISCCVIVNKTKGSPVFDSNPYNLDQYGLSEFIDTDLLHTSNINGFESSNFRVIKDALNERLAQINGILPVRYVTDAIRALIQNYAGGTANFSQIERILVQTEVALVENDELAEDAGVKAEMFWSSELSIHGTELCSILNAAIREDDPHSIVHAVVFAKGIEIRRNMDRRNLVDLTQRYPDVTVTADMFPGGEFPECLEHEHWLACFRGGGFNDKFQHFFTVGKYYRCPGFLATSSTKEIAMKCFILQSLLGTPKVCWTILLDGRGVKDAGFRCMHASFVSKSHKDSESEFLFSPYSVFQVVATEWSSVRSKPHSIVLRAAIDNMDHPEDLPLAPWY